MIYVDCSETLCRWLRPSASVVSDSSFLCCYGPIDTPKHCQTHVSIYVLTIFDVFTTPYDPHSCFLLPNTATCMRLRTLLPTLPSRPKDGNDLVALLDALSALSINTAHDLILQTPEDGVLELPSDILNTFNYYDLLDDVVEAVAPSAQRGDVLYALEQEREPMTQPCTSGVKDIDDLFEGNVSPVGSIVEVSGLPRAGKTVCHF